MFFVIVMQGCGALLWLSSWLDIITNWAIGNYMTFWVACYIDLETGFRINMQVNLKSHFYMSNIW